MTRKSDLSLERLMAQVEERSPAETEFHQAVREFAADVLPIVADTPAYRDAAILDRLAEPERIVSFRVTWEDDDGRVRVNRGYRVQYSSAIGPYKGGIRFHPTVTQSVLKFLGFEQSFKNALTGLPMGGGKGGADFDPKGRSSREVMRFCNAFMTELHRHIGPDVDVGAGDINVGQREIGYLLGAYRRITNAFEPSLTGKGPSFGGSPMRTEATGFGLVYFACHMLEAAGEALEGKRVVISGAGNVATHAAEKAIEFGAKVVTLSDSRGRIVAEDGLDAGAVAKVRAHKSRSGESLQGIADAVGAEWTADATPWSVPCDIALPCARENELELDDARCLVDNGCILVAEGANMPATLAAARLLRERKVLFGPAKAANAGGVAVSGLEIAQNLTRTPLSQDEVCRELTKIMKSIHDTCAAAGDGGNGPINYARGANIAGFRAVADAMLAQGFA